MNMKECVKNMDIEDFNDYINQKKGELNSLENQQKETTKKLSLTNRELQRTEKCQVIIQEVAKLTQQQIILHIEDIVNSAIDFIFPNEYEFKMDFVDKRNKTECEIYLLQKDNKLNPITDNGGGVVDIVSFALRVSLWNLKKDKKLNTMILDEPFRFLSKGLKPQAGLLLKELSRKLKLQFIIITHDEEFINMADKIFKVKKAKGNSYIEI